MVETANPVDEVSLQKDGKSGRINLEIDELVPCLKDSKTGKILPTESAEVPKSNLKAFTAANGWSVDWKARPADEHVFGVYLKGEKEPQGLISLKIERGGVYMAVASTAPHNNKELTGNNQRYKGVGGHLFAIAVEKSFESGNHGTVYGYAANEKLLQYYMKEFGAKHFPFHHKYQFFIDSEDALAIYRKYTYDWRKQ